MLSGIKIYISENIRKSSFVPKELGFVLSVFRLRSFFIFLISHIVRSSSQEVLVHPIALRFMKDELEGLRLDDLENEQAVRQEGDDEFWFCLVGMVVTNGSIHFPSLKNVLSELWHPLEGLTTMKIEDKWLLFRFYNKVDLRRMLNGTPWVFNRHLLFS